jgi:hypothetical protein
MDKTRTMHAIQQHFASQLMKWDSSLEYIFSPLSWCAADETYYKNAIVQSLAGNVRAFSFEIGEPSDPPRWRYNGFFAAGSWRGRLHIPPDFDMVTLNKLVQEVTR